MVAVLCAAKSKAREKSKDGEGRTVMGDPVRLRRTGFTGELFKSKGKCITKCLVYLSPHNVSFLPPLSSRICPSPFAEDTMSTNNLPSFVHAIGT
jgi:hypothetical protein